MPKVDPLIQAIDKRIVDGGFSVVDLCARCHPPIHQSVVNRWRRGNTSPTLTLLRAFILALGAAEKEKGIARVAPSEGEGDVDSENEDWVEIEIGIEPTEPSEAPRVIAGLREQTKGKALGV